MTRQLSKTFPPNVNGGRVWQTWIKCTVIALAGLNLILAVRAAVIPPRCSLGLFGAQCQFQCHCAGGAGCDADTGRCFSQDGVCEVGWTGPGCNLTDCPPGLWGDDCLFLCACLGGRSCSPDAGRCPQGCVEGWSGSSCNYSGCGPGRYGPGCEMVCSCPWGGPCNGISGLCFDDWVDPKTKIRRALATECPPGTYGPNCTIPCSVNCGEDRSCFRDTGKCMHGCKKGFQGIYCGSAKPEEDDSFSGKMASFFNNYGSYALGILGGIGALISLFEFMSCLFKRKTQAAEDDGDSGDDEEKKKKKKRKKSKKMSDDIAPTEEEGGNEASASVSEHHPPEEAELGEMEPLETPDEGSIVSAASSPENYA